MAAYPISLIAFQRMFPDSAACARYLIGLRWPDGFCCPNCAHAKGWQLQCKPWTFECAACHRQTSVTAGTVLHGSKLPLQVWFWAAFLTATHSNGISALQLQKQLALGSYGSAWLLLAKLRRAMVDPDRNPLAGLAEIDETAIPLRTKDEPVAGGQGRSGQGKMAVIGAVEIVPGGHMGRIRLAPIDDYSADSLKPFIAANLAAGATVRTDGWSGYASTPGVTHEPHVIGTMAAHIVLPAIHRVFANLKAWGIGVYHGLRRKHLAAYLDEFTFRFNRRARRHAGFFSLLGITARIKPATYKMLIAPEPSG